MKHLLKELQEDFVVSKKPLSFTHPKTETFRKCKTTQVAN